MEKSGRSSLEGAGRGWRDLCPGAGAVMPPVQAGMLPSLLPARSAPVGVNADFSCSASCGETAAGDDGRSRTDDSMSARAKRHPLMRDHLGKSSLFGPQLSRDFKGFAELAGQ